MTSPMHTPSPQRGRGPGQRDSVSRAPGSQGPILKPGALVPGLHTELGGVDLGLEGPSSPRCSPPRGPLLTLEPAAGTRLESRLCSPLEGKFLKTAAVGLLSPALSLMAQCVTGPGAADCNTCPASFSPSRCQSVAAAQGNLFLPGRSLGGKPVRPGSLPASGVSKGPGNVATVSLSPASGFPDLRALRLARAQASTRLGAIPMPPLLGEHQWVTDPGSKTHLALSLFFTLALGP